MKRKRKMSGTDQGRLWGGRFAGGPSEAMFALSKSTQFDWRLALHDIAGSRAHAKALEAAGYLTEEQAAKMDGGLAELARQVEAGEFVAADSDEDVHGALERGLKLVVGEDLGVACAPAGPATTRSPP